jgi:hypothetical protein
VMVLHFFHEPQAQQVRQVPQAPRVVTGPDPAAIP